MTCEVQSCLCTPTNLQQQLSSFVGRREAIAEVGQLLEDNRLVTLLGTAGCGKTRLALQTVASLLHRYPGGVWYVELAMLAEPELVPQAVASALGIREEHGRSPVASLCEHLQPLKLLLVLDNCEHLLKACASLAYELLRVCPDLTILTTSRESLQISGEALSWVPTLSLPSLEPGLALELVGRFEAVELFVQRLRAHYPHFQITEANAPAIVQICRQLDGLPLAIELAAARGQVLAVEQIAARLDQRFQLLTTTDATVPHRQQTLTALLDWSYDLLDDDERALLSKLAVLSGSFTLEAAAALCGVDVNEYETIDRLSRLVNKSLIVVEEHNGEARYRLLETIRQYALEKLTESGDLAELRCRHRDWYLALAEAAQSKLTGSDQTVWLDRLDMEHDNLCAALEWSLQGDRNADAALRLSSALWRFWDMRGHTSEGRAWLSAALELKAGPPAPPRVRAKALNAAGSLAMEQNDLEHAASFHEQALELRRGDGDRQGTAGSLADLAEVARRSEEYDRAIDLYQQSLAIFRELADLAAIAGVLDNLGLVKQYQGDYKGADAFYSQAFGCFKQVRDKQGMGMALNNRGKMLEYLGRYGQARALYVDALALASAPGDKLSLLRGLNNLASVTYRQGKSCQAEKLYSDNLVLCKQLDSKPDAIDCLEGLAGAIACNRPERAAHLLGTAATLRDEIGSKAMTPIQRTDHEQTIASIRARLGEDTFRAALAIGGTMSLDEALASPPDQTRAKLVRRVSSALPEPPYSARLSRREVEVLRMVSAGMADAEVADQLVLSRRTVHAHLHSIYTKIGVNSRGEAARIALANNLL